MKSLIEFQLLSIFLSKPVYVCLVWVCIFWAHPPLMHPFSPPLGCLSDIFVQLTHSQQRCFTDMLLSENSSTFLFEEKKSPSLGIPALTNFHILLHCTFLLISMAQKFASVVTTEIINPVIASGCFLWPVWSCTWAESGRASGAEEGAEICGNGPGARCSLVPRKPRVSFSEETAAVLMPPHPDNGLAPQCFYLSSSVPEWMRKARANSCVRKLVTDATSG